MGEADKEFPSELYGSDWRKMVDISVLKREVRVSILKAVIDKIGFNNTFRAIKRSNSTLYKYLTGDIKNIPDEVIRRALEYLDRDEFFKILSSDYKLKVCGIIGEDGSVKDISVVSELLFRASQNELLRSLILEFALENFGEELDRMRNLHLASIKLVWSDDFETFLRERKKGWKVTTDEMIKKYRSYFKKYLEGKKLSYELIKQVARHKNGWVRNIFRHYVRYLWLEGKITKNILEWILYQVPGRSFKRGIRPYQIPLEDVRRTMEFLRKNHTAYYVVYRLMLESGIRFFHALELLASWSPEELVYIEEINFTSKRLVCFEEKGFCRYYLGIHRAQKTCDWVYFSTELLELIERIAPREIKRTPVTKYAKRHSLVRPRMIRKVAWRIMEEKMKRRVALFVQSRLGELQKEPSTASYSDLLSKADEQYPRYLRHLKQERLLGM